MMDDLFPGQELGAEPNQRVTVGPGKPVVVKGSEKRKTYTRLIGKVTRIPGVNEEKSIMFERVPGYGKEKAKIVKKSKTYRIIKDKYGVFHITNRKGQVIKSGMKEEYIHGTD